MWQGICSKDNLTWHSAFHTGNFKFYCEVCRKGFFRKELYDLHTRAHLGLKYPCEYCGKAYSTCNPGVCSIFWILCQFTPALIEFPTVIQWKCWDLLDTKQPKLEQSSTPLYNWNITSLSTPVSTASCVMIVEKGLISNPSLKNISKYTIEMKYHTSEHKASFSVTCAVCTPNWLYLLECYLKAAKCASFTFFYCENPAQTLHKIWFCSFYFFISLRLKNIVCV